MLPKIAYLADLPEDAERRHSPRRKVSPLADSGPNLAGKRVLLLDISEVGLRLQSSAPLEIGQTILVNLPQAGDVEARIVWRNNEECGARFSVPISKAAVSAAILASPGRENPPASPPLHQTDGLAAISPIYAELALLMLLPVAVLFLIVLAVLPISRW